MTDKPPEYSYGAELLQHANRIAFLEGTFEMARGQIGELAQGIAALGTRARLLEEHTGVANVHPLTLEEHTGVANVHPLTLEQRVQALEMCSADILWRLEQRVQALEMCSADIGSRVVELVASLNAQVDAMRKDHAERLAAWAGRPDTPASEVPPT